MRTKTTRTFISPVRFIKRLLEICLRFGIKDGLNSAAKYVIYRKLMGRHNIKELEWESLNFLSKMYRKGFIIKKRGNLFLVNDRNRRLKFYIYSPKQFFTFLEDFETMYCVTNYENKVIVDIGGFIGDTAVFFLKKGAKKVIIFEPQKELIPLIKLNLKENGYDKSCYEIYDLAVSKKDGTEIWEVDEKSVGGVGFGILKKGSTRVTVKTISWRRVIELCKEKNVDIIKVDCEGCEKYITLLSQDEVNVVPEWIIEAHNQEIANSLIKFFTQCGYSYKVTQIVVESTGQQVIYFYKNTR